MAHVTRLAALLLLMVGLSGGAWAADLPLEEAIKASYLYKFAPFVQWPSTAFDSPAAPLIICIGGQNPFGAALDEAVRGQRVNGHPIVVRHIEAVRPGLTCQILFVGGDNSEEMLRAVAGEPVLTVTDRSRGVTGGIIQFVTTAGRVRFMIDLGTAQNSGIAISSKLLGLAVSVAR
jgi:hypothetical protein